MFTFLVLLGLFLLALLLHYLFGKKDIAAKISKEGMPSLRPLPIPVKDYDLFMRIAIWLFHIRRWELIDNWHFIYESKEDNATVEIVLPKEFEFDGASIPRPLWAFLSPVGLLLVPGLIHDYGYKYNQLWQKDSNGEIVPYKKDSKREDWDELFRQVGEQINGMVGIDFVAYLGVKYFGNGPWKKHRQAGLEPTKPVE